MSNIKLDLSQFKHVKSDEHTTTLRHPNGHMITLSHEALAPKSQSQLKALSGASKEAATPSQTEEMHSQTKMAEGGEVYDKTKMKDEFRKKNYPAPNSGGVLDYGDAMKKEYYEKKKKYNEEDRMPKKKAMAEGGDPGAETPEALQPSSPEAVHPTLKYIIDQTMKAAGNPNSPIATQGDPKMIAAEKQQEMENSAANPNEMGGMKAKKGDFSAPPEESVVGKYPAIVPSAPSGPSDQDVQGAVQDATAGQPAPASAVAPSQAPPPPHPVVDDILNPSTTPAEHEDKTKVFLDDQTGKTMMDYANGHIAPQTYGDLFHYNTTKTIDAKGNLVYKQEERSTLGKIGMLFGMMASSIGSGMTKQPNAMLEMMDKTLQRDITAQQNAGQQAHNFMTLAQQHNFQHAQAELMAKQGFASEAQTQKLKLESAVLDKTLGANNATMGAYMKMADDLKATPPTDPQYAAKQQALGLMYQHFQGIISDRNAAAAGLAAYGKMISGQGNETAGGAADAQEQQFKQQVNGYRRSGDTGYADYLESHHIPGIPGVTTHPVSEGDRAQLQAMTTLDNKGKDVLNYIKENSGTLNPQKRATIAQKIDEMKTYYNASVEGGVLTEGRNAWYDQQFKKNATDIVPQLLGSTAKLEEVVNSNAMRRNSILKDKYSLPPPPPSTKPVSSPDAAAPASVAPESKTYIQVNRQTGRREQWDYATRGWKPL